MINQHWVNYNSGRVDMFREQYGYEHDSNRSSADDQVYKGQGQAYAYDGLNCLTADKQGLLNTGKTDVQSQWTSGAPGTETWTLDPLGNQDRGR